MPFVSEKQRKWMWATHPEMAARWSADEKAQDSRGLPSPPRKGSQDFKHLSPGPVARHKISKAASEQDAMSEGHGINFQPNSRPGPLGKVPKARLPGVKR